MTRIALEDAAKAMSGLQALRAAMTDDLDDVESYIEAHTVAAQSDAPAAEEMAVYQVMRASLYSGLACINEVLGWVKLMTENDPNGNVSESLKSLPTVPVFSIH
jgi:hypothetical protein